MATEKSADNNSRVEMGKVSLPDQNNAFYCCLLNRKILIRRLKFYDTYIIKYTQERSISIFFSTRRLISVLDFYDRL
jgi:hypothetical protein